MATKQQQKINSQEKLDELIKANKYGEPLECYVMLNYGLRSSKEISFNDDGNYWVYNECDDNEEFIPHNKLMGSFIGKAIEAGALYKY